MPWCVTDSDRSGLSMSLVSFESMSIDPTLFKRRMQIRWADIDANIHMRHSVYYELCAEMRMGMLKEVGLTMTKMQEIGVLPIIFREECKFMREIRHEDEIEVDVAICRLGEDYRKFSFRHQFTRNGELCAVSEMDGAWLSHSTRKITVPPRITIDSIQQIPKTEDFKWI